MYKDILKSIYAHKLAITIVVISALIIGATATIMITQSSLDENIEILEAGVEDIPIIKNDDLQELGEIYSKLNDQFEREIDALVTGPTNRHNKSNNTINPLTHYGVYGQENKNPFKNDDYVNGAIIKYEKATASIADGASNFNDIISCMSILYDQKMDTVPLEELKQVFTDIFWLSHTYTFDSSELYPCKHGCTSVDRYKCVDVYYDYNKSGHISDLRYDPFTVRKHSDYEDYGYDYDEDFRIVLPEGQCEVCGKLGAGCIWQENKVCYHRGTNINVASCEAGANTIEEVVFGDVGETYKAEDLEDEFISNDESKGTKIAKTDNVCRYYKIVKFCNTRKSLANQLHSAKVALASAEEKRSKHGEKEKHTETCCDSYDRAVEQAEENVSQIENQIENHISTVCEKDETTSKYWCDGYKVCLGHKTHYTCPSHKLVCCLGHTNITVTIKVLYKDEILKAAYDSFH